MTIKKLDDGRYEVDVRPTGRHGKRVRRKFHKKHEAIAFERHIMATHLNKPWQSQLKDARSVAELIQVWWVHHGQHAKWGARQRLTLERVNKGLGSLRAYQIETVHITGYRSLRMAQGSKASTINRGLSALSGMFSFLIGAGLFRGTNPLGGLRKLKVANTEMSYLTTAEINALLDKLAGDNHKIVVFCLNTGARWSEAAELRAEHVLNQRAIFATTKTGRQRVVPLSPDVEQYITGTGAGLLFPEAEYELIRLTIKEIKPYIPKGQALHVLRHTYATHFMFNGGNIITLQRILGHATIQQTMTYAHFAPDFLQDAITFNPLKGRITALDLAEGRASQREAA
ncbi:phage integrase [Aeromonas aquatica]|uniref:phage integrase n=1 Tax=Aeromonas aquatica TaxID=558964 RepID=UPI00286F45FF|nr:tyrosine-type recombinase/integrase [Aeromonas aquatica]